MEWYRNLRIVLSVEDKLPFLVLCQFHLLDKYFLRMSLTPTLLGSRLRRKLLARSGTSSDHERISRVQTGKRTVCKLLRPQNEELYRQLETSRSCHDSKPFSNSSSKRSCNCSSCNKSSQKNQKKRSHKAAKGNQGKGKAKMGYAPVQAPPFAPKPKNPQTPKKDNPAKDAICHQCGEVGHWRRNCPVYLAELMKKKKLSQRASTSRIFTIELYSFPSTSWVYDTGCGTHICTTTQGLRGSRKLKPGALSLYVGDGHRAAIEAIGESHFNKRAKLNLDSALLWHCRLGHISKKRIEKLQHDGLLDSTDIKSFEKCVSCMSEKMARKPYSHQVKRAKDLLGLIHADVCGPFKIMSIQGASYFVTFTDDFSRYGYVYLLKHKHEVFETFKVFQKEVENQLGNVLIVESLWDYALESAARILNMVPTKKVDKTPYEVWHGQAPKLLLKSRGLSTRTRRPTDRLCLYVDAEEHELGDLGEPANYKAALLGPESDKWLVAKGLDKAYDRFQKLISLLEVHDATVSNEDANQKFLRALPSSWNNIALIMRNKEGIDELDIDDLYNNLKVFEADIKGSSGSSSNSHNVAFLSAEDTNSINEVNTANGVSTAACHSSSGQAYSSSYTDDLMFSFFASQSNSPQLDDEDLQQIDHDDSEEMDLKWQVAMLSMRVKRFYKKIGRKLNFNSKEPIGFDKTKVECFNCHGRGHFARECRASRNQGNRNGDARNTDNNKRTVPVESSDALVVQDNALIVQDGLGYDWSYIAQEEPTEFALMAYTSGSDTAKNEVAYEEKIAVLEFEVKDKGNAITRLTNQLDQTLKEKEDLKAKLEQFEISSKNLNKLINSQLSAKDKIGLRYRDQLSQSDSEVLPSVFDSRLSNGDDNPIND
nr:hypothetical protein [Tanacetum cinerariifolium]